MEQWQLLTNRTYIHSFKHWYHLNDRHCHYITATNTTEHQHCHNHGPTPIFRSKLLHGQSRMRSQLMTECEPQRAFCAVGLCRPMPHAVQTTHLSDHFGRHPVGRALHETKIQGKLIENAGSREIPQFARAIDSQQDIGPSKIPVHEVLFMQIDQPPQNLRSIALANLNKSANA